MDAEDRRLLTETHAQAAATAAKVDSLVTWSMEVHKKREQEMDVMQETVDDHDRCIRIIRAVFGWAVSGVSVTGVAGVLWWGLSWIKAHAR